MLPDQAAASLLAEFNNDILPTAIQYAIGASPIVVCVLLCWIFWPLWVNYIRSKFFLSLKYSVLEIKLPKETFKSPLAMEAFLNGIHNTSDGNWMTQYWKGEIRPYYSLEVISIEGRVKFMIWCESRRKAGVMTALYSQFPRIEITEVEDYSRGVQFDPKTQKLWAGEFIKLKDDAYPIKTYVDYGLDKDPKEEFKVDPMLAMLEFLGSVPQNSQVWIQIMVRAHKKDQRKPGHLIARADLRLDRAKEIVDDILHRDPKTKLAVIKNQDDFPLNAIISEGEKDFMKAVTRAASKPAFDVGIRAIYLAKKDIFDTPFGIGGCISSFKNYNTEDMNGFKPNGKKWIVQFDAPWKDYKDIRRNKLSKQVLIAYQRRSYFYPPFESKPIVLNTEELATIYHFPGSVAATPTLERVPSKRAEPPANLPI